MPDLQYRQRGELNAYDVLLDGEVIGDVRKWERSYNLRRRLVTRGWRARTASGERLYDFDGYTASTRGAAAAELVEATSDA